MTARNGLSGSATPHRRGFRLEEYFVGQTRAWGIFRDRFGRLRRQFKVEFTGDWDGETLTLDEAFAYDNGEIERRT